MIKNTKSIVLFILFTIVFSRCTTPLFVSEEKWLKMRTVVFRTNQNNIIIKNKKGEALNHYSNNQNHAVFLETLKKKNLTLTISHPDRKDTTIHLKRKIRGGAMFSSLFFIYSIPTILPIQFINTSIYKLSMQSRLFDVKLKYNESFYFNKYNEYAKKDTKQEYEEYIKNYPESKYAEYAQARIYEIDWNEIKNLNDILVFEKYISQFPNSPFKEKAKNKIYDIAYQHAVKANTPEAFENYISKYPNSPKLEDAKKAKSRVKEIDDAFAIANKTNTYKAYQAFLDNFPETKYTTQIAEKAANNYCSENLPNLTSLSMCNDVVKFVKDLQEKYAVRAEKLNEVENKRDFYFSEELKKVKVKLEYENLLISQYKAETKKEPSSNQDIQSIKKRLFLNENIKLSGTYSFWNNDDKKETINYVDSKKEGNYILFTVDEKIILEKGSFSNGNKNGNWVVNYEDGKKHFVQNWKNGILEDETEFNENGINLTEKRKAEAKKAEELRIAEEKRKEEESKPKLGINYWITKELINCKWCGRSYERTKTKYKDSNVMIDDLTKKYGIIAVTLSSFALMFNADNTIYDPFEEYCSQRCKEHL
jgi:outer membrane protein assembly factor BamD (BamD/ComL family)